MTDITPREFLSALRLNERASRSGLQIQVTPDECSFVVLPIDDDSKILLETDDTDNIKMFMDGFDYAKRVTQKTS